MTVEDRYPLLQRVAAEGLGTMLLLAAVIGSGIMAERLSDGQNAIALLANTAATVGALYVLIEALGAISGAHFNPAVSAVMRVRGALSTTELAWYVAGQMAGAVLGAWLANAMFGLDVVQFSTKVRSGFGLWLGEVVATAGLLLIIMRAPAGRVASMVAAYIGAAYWFTSSTSFANPAASLGRMFSDSFAGIAPPSVAAFVMAQCLGAGLGWAIAARLQPESRQSERENLVELSGSEVRRRS